jgi:hypothetical protein
MDGARYSAGRPLRAGAILNAAFELYRRQARAAWMIAAIIVVPAQVLVWIMVRVSLSGDAQARNGTVYASSGSTFPTVAINLLGFLAGALALGALTRLLVQGYTGRHTTWEEALAYASTHFVPLLILSVLTVLGLLLGYAFFLVPGIFLTVAWSAAVPALMFERAGPTVALRRSMELIAGYWWTMAGVLVLALLIIIGFSYLVDVLVAGLQHSTSIDVILTLQGLARAIGAILTYPFLAAVSVTIYANARARKEVVDPVGLMPEPPSR